MCGPYDDLGSVTMLALRLWPKSVPVTFLEFEVGLKVNTGLALKAGASADSPCRFAYIDYCARMEEWCEDNEGRASWDPMALLYAVPVERHC